MMAVIRWTGKVAAGAVPAALVAGLGLPALGVLVFVAVLAVGVSCWVVRSDARTDRVSRVLLAWRGKADCLPSAPVTARRGRGGGPGRGAGD